MAIDRHNPGQTTRISRTRISRYSRPLQLAGCFFLFLEVAPAANAQEAVADEALEEILVTGTRRQARSPLDVSSPVDVIGVDQLTNRGDIHIVNALRQAVPSLNVDDNPLSGTPTSMRPVALRGLSPDHVLVLVNGKRRHRGANIATFSGGNSDGSQGVDISSIPAIALERVEVLRAGASAQYGSDAIAGVVNFILDDSPTGSRFLAQYGSTYAGDGARFKVAGSTGMPLGDSGFLRLSASLSEQDESVRAVQRADAAALQAGANPLVDPAAVPDPATRFGVPDITDNIKLAINMGAEINDNAEFYAFGTFATRKVENDFFYRNPTERLGVFTDGSGNFLVGDMTPGDGMNCEGGVDFGGTGTVNNPIAVGAPNQVARMQQVLNDPNCFSFIEVFPGGYSPRFGSEVNDIAGATGIRGILDNGLTYDVSANAGQSSIAFFATNVPNPSMGSLSPIAFLDTGEYIQFARNINIDIAYPLEVAAFASPLNVAFGLERRDVEWKVVTGMPASFEAGVLANQGFLIGEEAIPGFSPSKSGTFGRNNIAAYIDLEADVTDQLVLGVAARYEDFSDEIGSQATYKGSFMYHFSDAFAVRGTVATGFHAPSPGQQHFSTTTTEFSDEGELTESGQIPPTSPTALAVGAEPLTPETSESMGLGFVLDTEVVSVTLDGYYIEMEDRLTLSASQQLTPEQIAQLVEQGFTGASGFGSFRFFTNDFATETFGVDLVLDAPLGALDFGGRTHLTAAFNYNQTDVTSFDPSDPTELLDEVRVTQIEDNFPNWKGNVSIAHDREQWRSQLRINYWGEWTEMHVNGNLPIKAGNEITVNLEVGYQATDRLELVAGADNLFGNEPTLNPWDFIVGSKFPTTTPYGLDNGFWYLRLNYRL